MRRAASARDGQTDRRPDVTGARHSRRATGKRVVLPAAESRKRLAAIADILDTVEGRCLAVDGPVARTSEEITDGEIRRIYRLATRLVRTLGRSVP